MDTQTVQYKNLPKELIQRSRIQAIKQGITFRQWLIDAITEKVEREEGHGDN